MYHYRKTRKRYDKLRKDPDCPFCNEAELATRSLHEGTYFRIVRNDPGYDIWEHHTVEEHLMILPKRHVERISEFTPEEQQEYVTLMGQCVDNHYSVYARANSSPRRTLGHQHTHLFRIHPKEPRASFMLRKPYLVIKV